MHKESWKQKVCHFTLTNILYFFKCPKIASFEQQPFNSRTMIMLTRKSSMCMSHLELRKPGSLWSTPNLNLATSFNHWWYLQLDSLLNALLDGCHIVLQSSFSLKKRVFFHELDFTFIRSPPLSRNCRSRSPSKPKGQVNVTHQTGHKMGKVQSQSILIYEIKPISGSKNTDTVSLIDAESSLGQTYWKRCYKWFQ